MGGESRGEEGRKQGLDSLPRPGQGLGIASHSIPCKTTREERRRNSSQGRNGVGGGGVCAGQALVLLLQDCWLLA